MLLYLFDIRYLHDFSSLSLLTAERQERFAHYLLDADKKRCLAAGLLLRRLLKEAAGAVVIDRYGKPYLPGSSLCFNLSHSGDYVVLAADQAPVGVDVEYMGPIPQGVAERCYTPKELDWLYGQSDAKAAFYRLWTGKESVMKATGLGFSLPPETFSIMEPTDGLHRIHNAKWHMNWYPLDGHALCVSSALDQRATPEILRMSDLLK